MKIRRLLPFLLLLAAAASADPFLLQSENLGRTDHLGFQVGTEGGYETGSIPDWVLVHSLGMGLFDRWNVELEAAWGGFPGQGTVRLDTIGAAGQFIQMNVLSVVRR